MYFRLALFAAIAAGCLAAAGAAIQDSAHSEEDPWAAPPPPWEGTWQGTIGNLPIHLCLNNTPFEDQGAYYYDQHKALIRLDLDKADQEWLEGEGNLGKRTGPRLKLAPQPDVMVGTWTDGRKTLPVRLRRIGGSSQEYEGPCSTMVFQLPRVAPVRIASKVGTRHGAQFTTSSFEPGTPFKDVQISTFTLDRSDAGVQKVNAILREILPKPDGTGEWLNCMGSNTNAFGTDGSYWESIEPTLITNRWLAVAHAGEYYCGGAHPENYNRPRVFDLASGAEIDPHDWFKPTAVHVEHFEPDDDPAKTLTASFMRMLLKGWKPEDPECDDAVWQEDYWDIGIARGALTFSPSLPRVVMACGESFKVPFAKLQPWLNPEGKAAVATLPR